MRTGFKQMFNRIFIIRFGAFQPHTTSFLNSVSACRSSLDVALMANCDNHSLSGDQVIEIHIAQLNITDFGTAFLTILVTDLNEIFLDDFIDICAVRENSQVLADFVDQRSKFIGQLFLLEVYELTKCHFENSISLNSG